MPKFDRLCEHVFWFYLVHYNITPSVLYIVYILSYYILRCSPHRRKQTSAIRKKALEHTVSAACFKLFALLRLLRWAPRLGAILVPSPGRPRCAPSSLPAPRPAAPTASLTLPTPHTVPNSRLAPEGCAMGERSFQHKHMVLAGRRGSRLPLSLVAARLDPCASVVTRARI